MGCSAHSIGTAGLISLGERGLGASCWVFAVSPTSKSGCASGKACKSLVTRLFLDHFVFLLTFQKSFQGLQVELIPRKGALAMRPMALLVKSQTFHLILVVQDTEAAAISGASMCLGLPCSVWRKKRQHKGFRSRENRYRLWEKGRY